MPDCTNYDIQRLPTLLVPILLWQLLFASQVSSWWHSTYNMSETPMQPVEIYDQPFHEGEIAIQEQAGTAHSAASLGRGMISSHLGPGEVTYLQGLQMIVISSWSRDTESEQHPLWTSMLFGDAGFIRTLSTADASLVTITASIHSADPLRQSLVPNAAVGLLAIDLMTRHRLRINTKLVDVTGLGPDQVMTLQLRVLESLGNCPKHIQRRQIVSKRSDPKHVRAAVSAELTPRQMTLLQSMDTIFVGTFHPTRGADASHRGGFAGFLRSPSPTTVWWADYDGNGMFNTLGNIQVTQQLSLVAPDWSLGHTLHVSGLAEVEWLASDQPRVDRANRLVRMTITHVVEVPFMIPFTYEVAEDWQSPFNPPLSGVVSTAPKEELTVTLLKKCSVAKDVATFAFQVPDGPIAGLTRRLLCHIPGEYVTFDLHIDGQPVTRTWTISSFPACLSSAPKTNKVFSITVKREVHGLASTWLHDTLQERQTLTVTGVGGGHTISTFMAWPTTSLAQVFAPDSSILTVQPDDIVDMLRNQAYPVMTLVSAGIGLTPMMASLRSLRQLQVLASKHALEIQLPEVTFAHSTRTTDMPFANELGELLEVSVLSRVVLHITQPATEKAVYDLRGRFAEQSRSSVTINTIRFDTTAYRTLLPESMVVSVFLCGPATFMSHAQDAMVKTLGLSAGFLHEEAFFF
eukprot:m.177927 g.177927  ORF g.177927 m.177927 type:complete len:688 (-) comp16827_c0_seq4:3246-5309(-)